MKKLPLLSTLAFTVSGWVWADSLKLVKNPLASSGDEESVRYRDSDISGTSFERLERNFKNGGPLSFQYIYGAWSGHCFEKVAPDHAFNDIFGAYATGKNAKGVTVGSFGLYHAPGYGPSIFNMIPSWRFIGGLEHDVKQAVTDKEHSLTHVARDGSLTEIVDFRADGHSDILYTVRKSGGHFIVQKRNLVPHATVYSFANAEPVSDVPAGVWGYCDFSVPRD